LLRGFCTRALIEKESMYFRILIEKEDVSTWSVDIIVNLALLYTTGLFLLT